MKTTESNEEFYLEYNDINDDVLIRCKTQSTIDMIDLELRLYNDKENSIKYKPLLRITHKGRYAQVLRRHNYLPNTFHGIVVNKPTTLRAIICTN